MNLASITKKGLPGLASRRKGKGLVQQSLADRVAIHRITLANYEIGAQDPKLAIVRRLAAALDCTPADLLTAPKPALVPAEELAQAEAELVELEARIRRLKAEISD